MLKISLKPLAKRDLLEIWFYIAEQNQNPEAADKLISKIHSQFVLIQKKPRLGRVLERVKPEIRKLVFKNYLVFYRVTDTHIEVVRCLHSARDWINHI